MVQTHGNGGHPVKRFVALALMVLISGCYGRIHDDSEGRLFDWKAYGLDGQRPAVVVFGAVWCKPCLSEIKYLNRAQRELNGEVQIAGFVVEGPQKGVAASPKDKDLFQGPGSVTPEYAVKAGASWDLLEQLDPPSGHALPTLVFVNRDQRIVKIVQRSMEFESELMPMLKAIASGEVLKPEPPKDPPTPPGNPDAGHFENLGFAAWKALPGNAEGSAVYENLHAAWLRGLEDFTFLEDDMPFAAAKMKEFLYDDGRNKPVTAIWTASMTGCKLTLFLNPDGSYEHSEGICK